MRKRVLAMALSVLLAISLLAGCTGGSSSTAASTAGSSGASDAPVTLRFSWWGADARHEATLKAIDRYTELHPNVTIEGEYQGYDGYQQKLMTQIAGGTEPDIIQLDYVWFPELAAQGDTFADLSTLSVVDLTPYSESVLEQYCSINGKVIALPMGTNGFGIMINKAFFEKHNIPLDTEWTWEKMIEIGREIHATNPNDYLFSLDSGTSAGGLATFVLSNYIYSKTGKYWANETDNTINASKEDLSAAFTMMKELFDSGAAQPLGDANLFTAQIEQNPKWLNGEMGFTLDWSGTVSKYKEVVGADNFAVGKPPYVEGGVSQSISFKPSMVLGVSNKSANVEVAADFANWMMNDPEAVEILGTQRSIPTNQNAFNQLSEAGTIDKDVAEMVDFTNLDPASPPPLVQNNAEVADIIKDLCEQVVFGKLTPDAAADKFLADVQAKMDTLKTA